METDNHVTLTRFRAFCRPSLLSPYKRIDGEWVSRNRPIYVRRMHGKPMAMSMVPLHGYTSLLTTTELAFVKAKSRKFMWKLTVTNNDLNIPRFLYLNGDLDCNTDLLVALNKVGRRLGKVVFIRSGRRTLAEQQELWNQNMDPKTGKPKAGRPLTARPNPNAPHVRGVAADSGIDGYDLADYPGAFEACVAEGVGFPVPGEDWHAEITDNMVGARS